MVQESSQSAGEFSAFGEQSRRSEENEECGIWNGGRMKKEE